MTRLAIIAPILALTPLGWSQTCPGNPVTVKPGDNLQSLVTSCPSGTTFNLAAGTHRDSVTSIKSNDVFSGAAGAVENGAKTLTGWTQVTIDSVIYWTTAGGAPNSTTYDSTHCQVGYAGCFYPQDLYLDNGTYLHVTSLASVAAGKWYYDLAGGDGGVVNNIYLANSENPNSHTVELGSETYLFQSDTAQNVTINGLTWEKYAADIDHGAVQVAHPGCGSCSATGWVIKNNEARLSHGNGIHAAIGADNVQVLSNLIHDNGQEGISIGRVNSAVLSGNTIYGNNTDHVSLCYGAGGLKAFASTNLTVYNNISHDNHGPGLWSDGDSNRHTYDLNQSYSNEGEGIRYEVSNTGTITNNTVYGNGTTQTASCSQSAQISYVSSSGANIHNNNVTATAGSLGGIQISYNQARDGEHPDFTFPVSMTAKNNSITVTSGTNASRVQDVSGTAGSWEVAGMFDTNTYCVSSLPWSETNWIWGSGNPKINLATWQGDGQDGHGTLTAKGCPDATRSSVRVTGPVKFSGHVSIQTQ